MTRTDDAPTALDAITTDRGERTPMGLRPTSRHYALAAATALGLAAGVAVGRATRPAPVLDTSPQAAQRRLAHLTRKWL